MTRAIDLSHDQSYTKVSFDWTGGQARYTDWTSDLPGDYVSQPSIGITLPENSLTLEDSYAQFTLPIDDFVEWLTDGRAKQTVDVTVQEVISHPDGSYASTLLTTFAGQVRRVVRNASRRSNVAKIIAVLDKARLDTPLGIPCTHQCPWTLFGAGCGLDPVLYRVPLLVTDVEGKDVTVSADPSKDDHWFTRGVASALGVSLTVREWRSATPTVFRMIRRAPLDWIGQSVQFHAGCDKSDTMCDVKFGNKRKWGGIGKGIPAYHPLYEEAQS